MALSPEDFVNDGPTIGWLNTSPAISPSFSSAVTPANCRMVRQASTRIGRCHCPGAPPPVDCIAHSFSVGPWHRPGKCLRQIVCPAHRLPCPIRLNVQTPILCVVHWIQGAGGGFLVLNPGRRNAICRRRCPQTETEERWNGHAEQFRLR